MILAALLMGLLVGLVILDETEPERPGSPSPLPVKSRRAPIPAPDSTANGFSA